MREETESHTLVMSALFDELGGVIDQSLPTNDHLRVLMGTGGLNVGVLELELRRGDSFAPRCRSPGTTRAISCPSP